MRKSKKPIFESSLTQLSALEIQAERAEIVSWQGREALRLENGLALIPDHPLSNASFEVMIGVDQAAYPGIVFRLVDKLNYELAYAVPHVSGQWDAIQYDPVFRGSNTWQVHFGPAYQGTAQVPMGQWFKLKVDLFGERAAVAVDGQPSLVVEQLAHHHTSGWFGLWTFQPAYFCDLRVWPFDGQELSHGKAPTIPAGTVETWLVEGFGAVTCEPNGVVNLNRYLPATPGAARLTRRFELAAQAEVDFTFGFSDALALELDGETVYSGETLFKGFADRLSRGYAEVGTQSIQQTLAPGVHCLTAALRITEPFFGWGLALAVHGEGLRWLPVELG